MRNTEVVFIGKSITENPYCSIKIYNIEMLDHFTNFLKESMFDAMTEQLLDDAVDYLMVYNRTVQAIDEWLEDKGIVADEPEEGPEVVLFKSEEANEEPEEVVPDKPKKEPVDVVKIYALANAGWSVKAIADDLGCSGNTVYNHLSKRGGKE